MQQVDSRTKRRGQSAHLSQALPQFALQPWEVADPDRTLERLPALSADRLPDYADLAETNPSFLDVVTAPATYVSTRDLDSDMAATIELVPEVSLTDILEESRPARPPLLLPAPVSVPIDLTRLLARAHAEASRSPEFFHAASATAAAAATDVTELVADSTPFPMTVSARKTSAPAAPAHSGRVRSRAGWVLGMVGAVVAVSLGIAISQSGVSAARSVEAVSVTRAPAARPAPVSIVIPRATAQDEQAIPAQSLPRVESGTVSLAAVAASHRLFIDGRVAEGGSAVVKCGTHLVQVGSRGARRTINVPCGQEVVLDR